MRQSTRGTMTRSELAALVRQTHGKRAGQVIRLASVWFQSPGYTGNTGTCRHGAYSVVDFPLTDAQKKWRERRLDA